MYYIAYGSNLNLEQMSYRCPSAKVVGSTIINGYNLLFRGAPAHAVATIEKRYRGIVPALVWDIQPADEQALDRYEGYPSFYRKETLHIYVNGDQLEAMIYVMNTGRSLGVPSRAYFNTILQGYMSAEFDIEILNASVRKSLQTR